MRFLGQWMKPVEHDLNKCNCVVCIVEKNSFERLLDALVEDIENGISERFYSERMQSSLARLRREIESYGEDEV